MTSDRRLSWSEAIVGDLIAAGTLIVGDGYRAKNSEMADAGVPFARAANIRGGIDVDGADLLSFPSVEKAGSKVSQPGDVIFTSKGTVGRFALVRAADPVVVYAPQVCFWRCTSTEVFDPAFLYYWMHGPECVRQFNALKGQTDMADYISLRDQATIKVTLPPLAEQRRIAAVLGALDAKIDHSLLLAHSADQVWVAFAQERSSDAAEVGASDLTTNGILLIGDGYRAMNRELTGGGVAFLRAGNLTPTGIEVAEADRLPEALAASTGVKRGFAWDSAFTSKGTVGRVTLVGPESDAFVYSPQVCFWRSTDHELLSPFMLHAWMRGQGFVRQVNAVKSQTDMADYVSLRDQRAMVLPVPSPKIQAEITRLAAPLAARASSARAEARRLGAIKNELLPRLVTGAVRVAEDYEPLGTSAMVG